MALSSEIILTLQQLNGIGTKTILKIAEQSRKKIADIKDLCVLWKTLKGKKIETITSQDLIDANDIAKRIIESSAKQSIGLISYYDINFPKQLQETINEEGKSEPPLLLWYKGDISVISMPAVAIVGTREVTSEGIKGDLYISGEFAKRGFNIVSGLAIGCDTYAHKGALNVGGKTTAFLANSLEYSLIYPSENKGLAEEIVDKGGLLLSEYSIGKNANKYNLVARDRLQSALSLATIVIQTGIKGGTMHAANTTLKSGKPLYAMKYKDEFTNQHEKSLGNAYLVKQGAKYISGGDNIDELCQSILNSKPVEMTLF